MAFNTFRFFYEGMLYWHKASLDRIFQTALHLLSPSSVPSGLTTRHCALYFDNMWVQVLSRPGFLRVLFRAPQVFSVYT